MKIEPTPKHKVVMLIDDDGIDNFINEKIIKKTNFTETVFVHTNATSALEFLKSIETLNKDVASPLLPSYIFLDINMPISDGFHFLEEFNKFSKRTTLGIKIIILTSSLNPADEAKSYSYENVVKYLSKPLSAEHLMDMH